jgi:ankyrin repeat protein
MTPLHYACRFKAPKEAVRILLHTFPSKGHAAAGRRDKRGRTPLFYAVRYDAPPGVVEMLLEVDPSVVSEEDKNADSALGLVWDTWADKFEGKKALMPYIREFEPVLASGDTEAEEEFSNDKEGKKDNILRAHELRAKIMNDPKVAGKWNKVNIFLSAAFKFNPGDNFSATDGNGTTIDGSKKRKWRVLHGVCAIKCHVTLFHMAKALYPEQVFELDENDLYGDSSRKNSADPSHSSHRTALHFAAASPASGKDGKYVISSLLSLHPEAASVADNVDGSLPLHLIAENDNKSHWLHDGVSELHLANPQAVEALDRSGRTPLHRATASLAHRSSSIGDGLQHLPASPVTPTDVERRQHIDVSGSIILNLLEAYPGAASIADTTGRLPLHLIAEHGETWDAEADAILKAHPAAIQTRARPDSHSRLPIHMAALSPDANISLISKLVTSHPRALSQADGMGKLPLHLACEGGLAWENGVGVIYDTYKPAIKETESNTRRWTALHSAAASPNAGGELVAKLTELYPQAAQVRDGKGRYPLHLACVSGKGWEGGVRNIFDAFPDAILARDKSGSLPFHMSALNYCSGTISLNKESDKKIAGTNHADASRTDHTHTLDCGHRTVDDLTKIEILYHLLREQPIVLSHH